MSKKNLTSGLLSGLTVFIGLMPLTFTFSQNGTQLLLETSFKYIVWFVQAVMLFLLLLTKHGLSRNQLIGLSVLFALVPFAFTFNENGVSFLILNRYISSILSWAIAGVIMGKLLLGQKLKENSKL